MKPGRILDHATFRLLAPRDVIGMGEAGASIPIQGERAERKNSEDSTPVYFALKSDLCHASVKK
jgi:hypothetical protein